MANRTTTKALTASHSSAFGKCIIVGEHAVIYGAYAVAIPLKNFNISLTLTPIKTKSPLQYTLSINDQAVSSDLTCLIERTFLALNLKPQSISIKAYSNLIVGGGLGSSAALCLSILKVIAQSANIYLTPNELSLKTTQLEKIFHGNPSGLDTAAVSSTEPILYNKMTKAEPFTIKPLKIHNKAYKWPFILIDSREKSTTLKMVKKSHPFFTSANQEQILEEFDRCAILAKKGLSQGNIEPVVEAITHCRSLLEQASVSSPTTTYIIQKALDIGALAAKTTGGGGGGCVLALLDPKQEKKQLDCLTDHFGKQYIYKCYL